MMQEVEEPLLNNYQEKDDTHLEVSINHDPAPSPDPTMIPPRYTPMSRHRIVKNLFSLCMAMFMYFIGFMALSNLQSTMNSESGVGTESQAVIYIASMLSALLLPELMVKKLGCKCTLFLAVLFSIPYIAANFYPRLGTLLPTAFILGLSAGPLTASQSLYVNELALRYHKGSLMESSEVVVSRFFGFNSFASESTQIWGNLISYYVLSPSIVPTNATNVTKDCGVNFINDFNNTNSNLQPPTTEKRILLVAIYLFCGFVSLLIIRFSMDPLENDVDKDDGVTNGKCSFLMERLTAALKHAMRYEQILLIPLSVFCGIELSFYASDFTQAFIACSWGVHHVGFVTICFGVCGALMAILVGPLVKFTNQMCVILFAACVNIVTFAMLFVWVPKPDHPVTYFIFAGVWGMTDAIWWSQIAALYGLMFPQDREAAFSNFFFWSFLGYFLSYSYANYFNVAVKINIMMAFLIVGITLYLIGQVKIKWCTNRSTYVQISETE